jgi:2-oxopent-4-enoate/cis-2-oxohex-4-enoate hydratase
LLTEERPGLSIEDAYAISFEFDELRKKDGVPVTGKKVGMTSKPVRGQFGIWEPILDVLVTDDLISDGGDLDLDKYFDVLIETEIAFYFKGEVGADRYPVKASDIYETVSGIGPALEIVDSRFENWRKHLADNTLTIVLFRYPVTIKPLALFQPIVSCFYCVSFKSFKA